MKEPQEYLIEMSMKMDECSREEAELKFVEWQDEDPMTVDALISVMKKYGEDCVQNYINNPTVTP